MLRPAPATSSRCGDLLALRASISSGLPPDPDPADEDATPEAAKSAAEEAEAARWEDAAGAAAPDGDYAQFQTPNGLEENSAFHAAPGAENVGIVGAGDEGDPGFGAEGDVIRVILAVCRATQLTPNPALPSVDNKFEYLVVLQDREGEEWVMGSVWDLPQCEVKPGQHVDEAVAELLEAIGLDENTTAVYPDYFRSPVYLPPKGETTPSLKAQRQAAEEQKRPTNGAKEADNGSKRDLRAEQDSQGMRYTPTLPEQAEILVVADNKLAVLEHGGQAALRWLDTKDIVEGWQADTPATSVAPSRLDGTFLVAGHRVAEDIVGVLARMERIRELQAMNFLVDIRACKEHFKFIQVMKTLYDEHGFNPEDLQKEEEFELEKEVARQKQRARAQASEEEGGKEDR